MCECTTNPTGQPRFAPSAPHARRSDNGIQPCANGILGAKILLLCTAKDEDGDPEHELPTCTTELTFVPRVVGGAAFEMVSAERTV